MKFRPFHIALIVSALVLPTRGADNTVAPSEKERDLIQTLRGDAPGGEKAIACKKLAIYGTSAAVPALEPLLLDEHLTSWARTALEAIPGPAADQALRQAATKANGRVLVGILNSIGVRRDTGALNILTAKLTDADPQVASAAAVALGKVGGTRAAKQLMRALQNAPDSVRAAAAQGSVRCAERFIEDGNYAEATKLYDAVCQASVPTQMILEGIRGAILSRGSAGVPLLITQLESQNRNYFNIGLRVARELPGPQATDAVIREFRLAPPERQPLLLLALADRGDHRADPVIAEAARNGSKSLRLAAVEVMDRAGSPSSLPLLLEQAAGQDPEISDAAMSAVARLGGNEVDSQLLARLPDASGKMRQCLITLAARRGIEKAVPTIVSSIEDSNTDIRNAAIQALANLGSASEAAELSRLLEKTQAAAERAHLETVLVALSGRIGSNAVPSMLFLTRSAEPQNRKAVLAALGAAGGTEALAAIAALTDDNAPAVQDEAVRTLCSWPNAWPDDAAVAEPLLKTAKNGNSAHKILALRGYMQFLLGDEKLNNDDKLARFQEAAPLLQRSEEKTSAIAVLQSIPNSGSLELLETYAGEPTIAEPACLALVEIVNKNKSAISAHDRQKALQCVVEKSSNAQTKQKANETLKSQALIN